MRAATPKARLVSRRSFAALALGLIARQAQAAPSLPLVRVTKDPNCGCCSAWIDHIRADGFRLEVADTPRLNQLKARLRIPTDLWSCHTAEVSGYVIEGHVPSDAIRKLLLERPKAIGLAVPGMPVGSPGMTIEGAPDEEYDVIIFGAERTAAFARYRGRQQL